MNLPASSVSLMRGAGDHPDGRVHAQRLLEGEVEARQRVEVVVADRLLAERAALLAQALLPVLVDGEVVAEHRQGDRAGVVGGHQHEDHVVDDVLVGELLAVLGLGVAEDAEEVVARALPLGRQPLAEVLAQQLAAAQAAMPLEPVPAHPDVGADEGLASVHGVDEGVVEAVGLRTELVTDEDLGGDVEGQLLGGGVEREGVARLPGGNAALDRRVHLVQVGDQPVTLERALHDPAVVAVLLEVHQHHAAVEERADEVVPALLVRERAVACWRARSRGCSGPSTITSFVPNVFVQNTGP